MSERIRLRVLGISYNQLQSGAYALLMAQDDGPYRIPIVIGSAEAHSIAIKLEGIQPPRPLTHDLFVSFANSFGIRVKEVFIYQFADGIFSSELILTDGSREVKIDARTSDAIAIALRTRTPIYTTQEILEQTGFVMEVQEEESENRYDHTEVPQKPRIENYTIEELERTLGELIDEERYEEAEEVSKILDRKRREEDKK